MIPKIERLRFTAFSQPLLENLDVLQRFLPVIFKIAIMLQENMKLNYHIEMCQSPACLPIGEDEVGDAEKNKRIEDGGEGNKVEMHCVFVCCVYVCSCVFRDLLSPLGLMSPTVISLPLILYR